MKHKFNENDCNAMVRWHPVDIQEEALSSLDRELPYSEAKEILDKHSETIKEAMLDAGWHAIYTILSEEEPPPSKLIVNQVYPQPIPETESLDKKTKGGATK